MGRLEFLLNGTPVRPGAVGPGEMLLGWLRRQRRLTGSKEGCAEGDCGACTVLAGRLGPDGALTYLPVNACITPLAACHRRHIVTIEHLRAPDGGLHVVQRAMMDHHASQCGFCTPGIVMALYALWMRNPAPSRDQIEVALQGNICRCTGYAPIIAAARAAAAAGGQGADPLAAERADVAAQLRAIPAGRVELPGAVIPADADDLAAVLAAQPDVTLVAGATDVGLWVTKQQRDIAPAVFIGDLMRDIRVSDNALRLGAGVTYAEAEDSLSHAFPTLAAYLRRIGGWQVRSMGTIGGNIANGSPIGDMPPVLIALEAQIVLRRGDARRVLDLETFFIDYGRQDRAPDEFVEEIVIPRPPGALIAGYKISKRRDSDISAVAMGLCLRVEDGRIAGARIACGGMAGVPRRAAGAEAALVGAPFAAASFEAAAHAIADDFQPLSDLRASAGYRRVVAANLLRRFWLEHSTGKKEATA